MTTKEIHIRITLDKDGMNSIIHRKGFDLKSYPERLEIIAALAGVLDLEKEELAKFVDKKQVTIGKDRNEGEDDGK